MRTIIFLITALLSPILISAQDEIGLNAQHVEPIFEFPEQGVGMIELTITIELVIDYPCITCAPGMEAPKLPAVNVMKTAHLDKKASFIAKYHSRYVQHQNAYAVDQWTFPNRFEFNAPWAWNPKKQQNQVR
ncbi:MAG: hypothetical protein AAFV80_23650 [Bacteroidota bacterium]